MWRERCLRFMDDLGSVRDQLRDERERAATLIAAVAGAVAQARAEATEAGRVEYERTLAVLREENSTLRRMLEATQRRADDATAELVKSLATSTRPVAAPLAAVPPAAARTSRDPIKGLESMFDPVPFDHPLSSFTNERAASLMDAEDEKTDGVSAAA